ncbi:Rho GTPase-activating protein 2 [Glycine soja]
MTGQVVVTNGGGCGGVGKGRRGGGGEEEQNPASPVAVLLAALRKSMVACSVDSPDDVISAVHHPMEIGWPTNVKHVIHVTFDRFNSFLGLPLELQVHVPAPVPSASVSVFGVSAESMQCSYDSKGNSVPTILLLMQERLYSQGGLKAEGIFRINPENSQEENLREQLNKGIVPDDIDVHCLAGLIKAWFRELPSGLLDGLSHEQVLECNTEDESVQLVKQLKPTESALLNWAIDLMADIVAEEDYNKMDARNIAVVFAPNMTQMSDPPTALMHAVQVMNLLKTLILKTLREREETAAAGYSPMSSLSSDCQSEDDYDSQQEMDTSGELRETKLDDDDDVN